MNGLSEMLPNPSQSRNKGRSIFDQTNLKNALGCVDLLFRHNFLDYLFNMIQTYEIVLEIKQLIRLI
jgi:hypothetical protein